MAWNLPDRCAMAHVWDELDPLEPADKGRLEDEGYEREREEQWQQRKQIAQ